MRRICSSVFDWSCPCGWLPPVIRDQLMGLCTCWCCGDVLAPEILIRHREIEPVDLGFLNRALHSTSHSWARCLPKFGWIHGRHWILCVYDRGELDHFTHTDPSEPLMQTVTIFRCQSHLFRYTIIGPRRNYVIFVSWILLRSFPA